jgi:hypothetical protein
MVCTMPADTPHAGGMLLLLLPFLGVRNKPRRGGEHAALGRHTARLRQTSQRYLPEPRASSTSLIRRGTLEWGRRHGLPAIIWVISIKRVRADINYDNQTALGIPFGGTR